MLPGLTPADACHDSRPLAALLYLAATALQPLHIFQQRKQINRAVVGLCGGGAAVPRRCGLAGHLRGRRRGIGVLSGPVFPDDKHCLHRLAGPQAAAEPAGGAVRCRRWLCWFPPTHPTAP